MKTVEGLMEFREPTMLFLVPIAGINYVENRNLKMRNAYNTEIIVSILYLICCISKKLTFGVIKVP